jgi:hypothetical protein
MQERSAGNFIQFSAALVGGAAWKSGLYPYAKYPGSTSELLNSGF